MALPTQTPDRPSNSAHLNSCASAESRRRITCSAGARQTGKISVAPRAVDRARWHRPRRRSERTRIPRDPASLILPNSAAIASRLGRPKESDLGRSALSLVRDLDYQSLERSRRVSHPDRLRQIHAPPPRHAKPQTLDLHSHFDFCICTQYRSGNS